MEQIKVSIILCTRNRADRLLNALLLLGKVRIPRNISAELIVVDNGSTDHTKNVIAACNLVNMDLRYSFEPVAGLSKARNRGILESNGTILMFADDDLEFPEDWVEKMCAPILSGQAIAVAGRITVPQELRRPWMDRLHYAWMGERIQNGESESDPELFGGSMAFHREVFEKIGHFDEALGAGALGFGEETLLSYQIRDCGNRIVLSDAVVIHRFDEHHLSRKSWLQDARDRGRSVAYIDYHWRHTRKGSLVKVLLSLTRYGLTWLLQPQWQMWKEGAHPTQLLRLTKLHYELQLWKMRNTPRKYQRPASALAK